MADKNYQELSKLKTFKERFNYLKINGVVGEDTFGFDRYLNQKFYKSKEWKQVRDYVITRDNGCDLGCRDHELTYTRVLIHHIVPLTKYDIVNKSDKLLDPNNLICTCKKTHDAIHYGDDSILEESVITVRSKNDTSPWLK